MTALEIKPDEVKPVDRTAHNRLTKNGTKPSDPVSELQSILTELRVIKNNVSRLIPRVDAALAATIDAKAHIKMRDILTNTAKYFGISELELLSTHRAHTALNPRRIAMYLCRTMTPRSYSQIARFFSDRDHTTIMHAVNFVIRMMDRDAQAAKDIKALNEIILTGNPKGDNDES